MGDGFARCPRAHTHIPTGSPRAHGSRPVPRINAARCHGRTAEVSLQARRRRDLVVPGIPVTGAVVLCERHMEDFVLMRARPRAAPLLLVSGQPHLSFGSLSRPRRVRFLSDQRRWIGQSTRPHPLYRRLPPSPPLRSPAVLPRAPSTGGSRWQIAHPWTRSPRQRPTRSIRVRSARFDRRWIRRRSLFPPSSTFPIRFPLQHAPCTLQARRHSPPSPARPPAPQGHSSPRSRPFFFLSRDFGLADRKQRGGDRVWRSL